MMRTFQRREFIALGPALVLAAGRAAGSSPIPPKTVVLTLDDAVKSHRTFVAPLLKELGFRATFFVTHLWMGDTRNFMTWAEIAEIHGMGFEIGNHAWTHSDYSTPRGASHLAGELALTEYELHRVNVPRPLSFAYCGNGFGPEAVQVVKDRGFQFARRGLPPEAKYGSLEVGAAYDPAKHHPLLIPSTGDAYPNWTFEQFERVVAQAQAGRVAVLQFHGVPDVAHPWVHTPPENFRRYMEYLKRSQFKVLALEDLSPYVNRSEPPEDPMLTVRYPVPKNGKLPLPVEVEATRADLIYWLDNMISDHQYSATEAASVCAFQEAELKDKLAANPPPGPRRSGVRVLPYPGGRHPRIGFRDGAVNPLRGPKASVFLPWKDAGYVVIDLPEAIFAGKELLFLAHTHIPTIWNERNINIENTDWQRSAGGALVSRWTLPDGVSFGASIQTAAPAESSLAPSIQMELWLENHSPRDLVQLRAQICVMLAGATEFRAQSAENKRLRQPRAAAFAGTRWIATEWQRCGRVWGNPDVPCMHSDPVLPDCAMGETVRVGGQLWFYEGVSLPG